MLAHMGDDPAMDTIMDTPCINVCVIATGTDLCAGCGRTLAEIAGWSQLGDAARRRVMAELPARLARHPSKPAAGPGESR